MSNLLKLTPENYYTKEANMQYVSVSQYKEVNGTTGKMGCEAYAMAKLRGEVEEVTTTALMVGSYVDAYFEGRGKYIEVTTRNSIYTFERV